MDRRLPIRNLSGGTTLFQDLQATQMIQGQSSRGKSKRKLNIDNFSLMVNVQEIYKPQVFEEAKGRPNWEKDVTIEHECFIKI